MNEEIEDCTFHISNKNQIYIYNNNNWYEINFNKTDNLYEKHDPSQANSRISISMLPNALNFIMKHYIENKK